MAMEVVQSSRDSIAELLGFDSRELFFTSGSTESINLAIFGFGLSDKNRPDILISAVEHPAVSTAASKLVQLTNGEVKIVKVHKSGYLDLEDLRSKVDDRTALISVMAANNETGVVQNHTEINQIAAMYEIPVFVDMTQALGKTELEKSWLSADAGCMSGHKIHELKNSGLLWIKRHHHKSFFTLAEGGGQQRGIRGGTENPAMAASLSTAIDICIKEWNINRLKYDSLKCEFIEQIEVLGIPYEVAANESLRLPQTLMMRIPGLDADLLFTRLQGVSLSQASACHSGNDNPSHVLLALGYDRLAASQFFRISFGRQNTIEEVKHFVGQLKRAYDELGQGVA